VEPTCHPLPSFAIDELGQNSRGERKVVGLGAAGSGHRGGVAPLRHRCVGEGCALGGKAAAPRAGQAAACPLARLPCSAGASVKGAHGEGTPPRR
jgi:hypothetical protein